MKINRDVRPSGAKFALSFSIVSNDVASLLFDKPFSETLISLSKRCVSSTSSFNVTDVRTCLVRVESRL